MPAAIGARQRPLHRAMLAAAMCFFGPLQRPIALRAAPHLSARAALIAASHAAVPCSLPFGSGSVGFGCVGGCGGLPVLLGVVVLVGAVPPVPSGVVGSGVVVVWDVVAVSDDGVLDE